MAFHGTASVLQGTPWHSMELHDIPWNFMAFHGTPSLLHGTPWNSMAFHGTPWILHGTPWILHGTPWHSMELHGYSMDTPWKFRGIPWISIYFHGIPWISIDFNGFPWISMEFHGGISHRGETYFAYLSGRNCSSRIDTIVLRFAFLFPSRYSYLNALFWM